MNNGGGPQGPTPDRDLNKIVFVYSTVGGPLEHWGIEGRIQAGSVFHLTGPDDNLRLQSRSMLVRSDFIDGITRNIHFVCQQNNRGRVRLIIDGMSFFMLSRPNTTLISANLTLLEDHVQSSEEICRLLAQHLEYANTLVPEQLPLEVPLLLFNKRMHPHQYAVVGSFEYVKKVNDANVIEIPYGHDGNGMLITNPVVVQPPASGTREWTTRSSSSGCRPRPECGVTSRCAGSNPSDDANEYAIRSTECKHDSTLIATPSGHYASQQTAASALDQSLRNFGY